jgi:hypothetical protein
MGVRSKEEVRVLEGRRERVEREEVKIVKTKVANVG